MKLSYGQIYIILQCGPTSQCSELNVISFKVNSHCAFTSRALISGVLELAKGGDVISESVLHSVELRQITLRHKSKPVPMCTLHETIISAFPCSSTGCEHPRAGQGGHRVQGCQPTLWPYCLYIISIKTFYRVRSFLIQCFLNTTWLRCKVQQKLSVLQILSEVAH